MFNKLLMLIYGLYLHRGSPKINWIEQNLDYAGRTTLSPNDMVNEPNMYEAIFSAEHRPKMEQLYLELLNEMNGVSYRRSWDVLDALTFIQEISATALWKYHLNVGAVIEEFVREFDRLDVPSERTRLYETGTERKKNK